MMNKAYFYQCCNWTLIVNKTLIVCCVVVSASDMDQNKNAEIEYSLDKEDFTIDNKGIIYSNKRLDADINNTYVLTVTFYLPAFLLQTLYKIDVFSFADIL